MILRASFTKKISLNRFMNRFRQGANLFFRRIRRIRGILREEGMLSRQNLPMPLLRVVLQFLSLAVSVMDILVMSQDEASARRTKRARAHYHERASLHCCKGRAYRDVAFAAGGIALGGKGPVEHAGPS